MKRITWISMFVVLVLGIVGLFCIKYNPTISRITVALALLTAVVFIVISDRRTKREKNQRKDALIVKSASD